MSEPAYAHYTVEREAGEKPATPWKTLVQALRWGWRRPSQRRVLIDPRVAVDVTDTVRVRGRDGIVVLSETFDDRRRSEAREAQITSDLLALDLQRFRKTYKIGP